MEPFQAIKEYADEQEEASISHLCHLFNVSRSGYYKWLRHQETPSEQENLGLMDVIKELHSQHNGIVAYVVGQFNDNELVLETLRKARKANPDATPLIHSDRGSQ